jgi:hypothetical protein
MQVNLTALQCLHAVFLKHRNEVKNQSYKKTCNSYNIRLLTNYTHAENALNLLHLQ